MGNDPATTAKEGYVTHGGRIIWWEAHSTRGINVHHQKSVGKSSGKFLTCGLNRWSQSSSLACFPSRFGLIHFDSAFVYTEHTFTTSRYSCTLLASLQLQE